MDTTNLQSLPAAEVLSLISQGESLLCPKCQAVVATIPANWTAELPLHGVECPKDQKHFLIYSEPAQASKNMKDLIRDMIKESQSRVPEKP